MWITRSKNGILSLFVNDCPHRIYNEQWAAYSDDHSDCEYRGITIEKDIFPELKWEDEPLEVFLYSKKEGTQYDFGYDDGYKEGYDAALEKESRIF